MTDHSEKERVQIEKLCADIPYAAFLGIQMDLKGSEITTVLPYQRKLIGNPLLPALHGGVISALLELTAMAELMWALGPSALPKPVDVNIAYLRSGRPQDTYARAFVVKQGRRVAHVSAEAWQSERAKPIATLQGHFLLKAPVEEEKS